MNSLNPLKESNIEDLKASRIQVCYRRKWWVLGSVLFSI